MHISTDRHERRDRLDVGIIGVDCNFLMGKWVGLEREGAWWWWYISSEAAKLELGDNESSHASTGIITERYQSS